MARLERARKFLIGSGRSVALKVIPLALLASYAYAGAALPSFVLESQSVTTIQNGGSGSFVQVGSGGFNTAPLGSTNGFEGLSISGTLDFSCSGSASCAGEIMDFGFSGIVSGPGPFPAAANVGWNFSVSSSDQSAVSYGYSILGNSGTSPYGAGNPVIGSGSLELDGSAWSLDLQITPDVAADGDTFAVTLPHDFDGPASIDISAQAPSAPEPASVLLSFGGLAALPFLRRRHKA